MADQRPHPRDELHDWLDGRLADAAHLDLEQHLAGCATCRRELEVLREARAALRGALAEPTRDPAVESALRAALERESEPKTDAARRSLSRRGWLVAAIGGGALLVVARLLLRRTPADLPTAVAQDWTDYQSGRLQLAVETSDAAQLAHHFAQDGDGPVRVIDLAMLGFHLKGGLRHVVNGRVAALYVYTGPANALLICQMITAEVAALPPAQATHEEGGFRFFVFERAGVTSVFWQERAVLCVLTGALPPQQLLPLAVAKAMNPA